MTSSNSINPSFVNSLGETTSLASTFFDLTYGSKLNTSLNNLKEAMANALPTLGIFSGNVTINGVTQQVITFPNLNLNSNTVFTGFFAQYSSSNPIPNTISGFVNAYNAYVKTVVGQTPVSGTTTVNGTSVNYSGFPAPLPGELTSGELISALTQDLQATSAQLASGTNSTAASIWGSALNSDSVSQWFTNFLTSYNYPSGSSSQYLAFFNAAEISVYSLFSMSAALTLPTTLEGSQNPQGFRFGSLSNLQYVLQYQAVYNALFPNTDTATQTTNFQAALQQFISQVNANSGGVATTPSQQFANWVSFVDAKYASAQPVDFTSLSSQNADKTAILNTIYALIASMVNSIQEVTAAQSTRLVTITNWQQAYSTELSQLPTFLTAGYRFLNAGVRSELNSDFNASLSTNMQTQQSIVGDDGKALQSNINQSNDAVSQQANMGQSLIQELNTLLSSIFPG